jgi:hypothetical protein
MEGNPEFLFQPGRIFLFVIDCRDIDQLALSKHYLEQAVNNITYFIPNHDLPIGIFLHKLDLVPEEQIEERISRIRSFLTKMISYPLHFYQTSIYDPSTIHYAVSDLLHFNSHEEILS